MRRSEPPTRPSALRRIAWPPPKRPWSLARDGRQAERLDLGGALPEPLLEENGVPLHAEARAIEGSLRVELVVHEGGDQLDMSLRLDEATHDSERAQQLAVAQEHSRDDRVVRTPAGLDAPGHGEAGAAVLEHDAGARRDHAAPEPFVEALDEGDGHPVTVGRAEIDSSSCRLGSGSARGAASAREEGRIEQVGDVRAVSHSLQRVLEREPDALDLSRETGLAQGE